MLETLFENTICYTKRKKVFMLRKSSIIAAILFISFAAIGQNENAEIYKKNKVKTIVDRSIMLGFEDKQDSCDEAFAFINEEGLMTKYIRDYKCQGWKLRFESTYEYDSLNRMIKNVNLKNDQMNTVVSNTYDENGEIIMTTVQSFEPPTFTITSREIFYNDSMEIDSLITHITGSDTMKFISYYSYFDGGVLQEERVYSYPEKERISFHTFLYNKAGKMTEYNVETFVPEYSYKKSGFDYDLGGRLVKSLDLDANTSLEFFPKANGLNVITMHYNRFGTLEKSVKHYYTYYK